MKTPNLASLNHLGIGRLSNDSHRGSKGPAAMVTVQTRIAALNGQIAADPRLGKQFQIGHSYVTPAYRLEVGETKKWFEQVVETEIGPLLNEYWFDAPDEAQRARTRLLQDW